MASCTDFITTGVVETDASGNTSIESIRFALLPERANPRRATLKLIPLVSSNAGCSGFVLPSGLTSSAPTSPLNSISPASDIDRGERNCTDFVLYATPDAPPVYSNNAGCTHFMLSNGLCSKAFTNDDIVWMERVADLAPGTLFQGFRSKDASVTERSYDPMTRYRGLTKAERRMPRGWKSWEHEENLRKSDPLINLSAWQDSDSVYESIKKTRAYKAHQAGLIQRALHAHARATRQAHEGRAMKGVLRAERTSNDSVMAVDLSGVVIASGSSGGSDDDYPAEASPTGIDTSLFSRLKVKPRAHPSKDKASAASPRQLFCDSPTSSVC